MNTNYCVILISTDNNTGNSSYTYISLSKAFPHSQAVVYEFNPVVYA